MAADLPDTSQRFREAMSICTMAGPGLAPRLDRLAETGWVPVTPDQSDALAFRDAARLDRPPDTWSADPGPVALPSTIYRHGTARLVLSENRARGELACRLAILNSVESDLLIADLDELGVVTTDGPVRRAAMASTVLDTASGTWRSEVRLSSADAAAANALLSEPLSTTLAVSFVTRRVQ